LRSCLHKHPGGSLLISHDRELLADVDSIDELSPLGLRRYGGNYDAYSERRDIEAKAAQRQLEQAKREMDALARRHHAEQHRLARKQQKAQRERTDVNLPTLLLDRKQERSDATRARQASAQRLQGEQQRARVADARSHVEERDPQRFDLGGFQTVGAALRLEQLVPAFGHSEPIDLYLAPGERLHLSGDNGSGKSSLLATIAGHVLPRAGQVRCGARVFLIDQHGSLLRDADSALENLRRLSPGHELTSYRQYLAGIGLRGERAELPVRALSGGERLKLALLALDSAREPYDLLLLDEPDGHLDLDSVHLLEQALAAYRGTLILISHDPQLVMRANIERELRLHSPLAADAAGGRQCPPSPRQVAS
jgi:ATPase subunit of ABC transporter with duplicated ATPase domains